MLRVMMLTTDLQRGGLPLRLVRLACRLRDVDVEPIVGCLAPPGPLSAVLESAGIETFSCDAHGSFDATCLTRLAGHVRRIRPNLIHSSLFHANLAARLVGRFDAPRPIITSTVTIEIERTWHRWMESLTCGWSDLHVANSAAVAAHVCTDLGFSPSRVVVIPNGVDIERIDQAPMIERQAFGIEPDVPLVVWAGRMDPVKDLATFVEVIALLRKRGKITAVLLGDGPERPHIQAFIHHCGLESVIRMALWSDNVAGWLKAADVLLFPSLTEGSPNVVIEAMLCRCPVVASDLPATRELIEPGTRGFLCYAGDIGHFTASIAELSTNDALRRDLVDAARQRAVQRHNIQHVVRQWRSIYDRMVAALSKTSGLL